MNTIDIRKLVPHAGPMVLLTRFISADAESLCAEVAIEADSLFFGSQGVGTWIGVEYMAQAIAAHAGYLARLGGNPVKIGFLLGSRRYVCKQSYFAPGSILHVSVKRALQGENGLGAFECRIDDSSDTSGIAAATATITVFQPDNAIEFISGKNEGVA